MSEPLVSIVLPTYNRAHLLGHAIRSVLAQTHRNLELIIVDDYSKDGTPEVVRGFDDARIGYVRNDPNLKLPAALNRGFALARGEFLTWTSDDNLYAETAIARMVAALSSGDCDFVFADYFDFARHDERGEPISPRRVKLPDTLSLDERNSVGACFMYTRKVYERIGGYDPELFLVEDYDYFIRIEKAGFRLRHIPEALYYFSRHDDSLFCARFAEVQAAGILVRYKNALIDEERAAEACVNLLTKDPATLNNGLLRAGYGLIHKTSFTLTQAYKRLLRSYLGARVGRQVRQLLLQFSSRALSFAEAKGAFKNLLQSYARLEYK